MILKYGLVAAAWCISVAAQAASVTLAYQGDNEVASDGAIFVSDGDVLTFEIVVDFSDTPTLGGGLDIVYDPTRLDAMNFIRLCCGGSFVVEPDTLPGRVFNLAFGQFGGITTDLVATIDFAYAGVGGLAETVIMMETTTGTGGPFISAEDFMTILDVDFGTVTLREVPVPGAAWLFASGLLVLLGRRRTGTQ